MPPKNPTNAVLVYQTESGALELKGDVLGETIWATQAQVADIFEIDRTVVTRHIKKILIDGELDQESNVHKMHIAHSTKPVALNSPSAALLWR